MDIRWVCDEIHRSDGAPLTTSLYQSTALTLLMRLIKTEGTRQSSPSMTEGLFAKVIEMLLVSEHAEAIREEFVEKYVKVYDDVRYYTFHHIGYVSSTPSDGHD